MEINFGGKKINIYVEKVSEFGKIKGLMFLKKQKAHPLLFEFKKPTRLGIHSFFVFFDFLAIWIDDKNNVLEYKIVKPFNLFIRPRKSFFKLIEIPLNYKYKKVVSVVGRKV